MRPAGFTQTLTSNSDVCVGRNLEIGRKAGYDADEEVDVSREAIESFQI